MARHGEDLENEIYQLVSREPKLGAPTGGPGMDADEVERYLIARYAEYCLFADDQGQLLDGQSSNSVASELYHCLNVADYLDAAEAYLYGHSGLPKFSMEPFNEAISRGLVKLARSGAELVTLLHFYSLYSSERYQYIDSLAHSIPRDRLSRWITRSLNMSREEFEFEIQYLLDDFPSSPEGFENNLEGATTFVLRNLFLRFGRMLQGWYMSVNAPYSQGFEDLRLVLEAMENERKQVEMAWAKYFLTDKQALTPSIDSYLRAAYLRVECRKDKDSLLRLGISQTDINESRRLVPRLRKRLITRVTEPSPFSMSAVHIAVSNVLPTLVAPSKLQSGRKGLGERIERGKQDA